MDIWVIFLTGLTTGGLSCLAMQGGLLASVIANQKEAAIASDPQRTDAALSPGSFDRGDILPVGMFLLAKLAVYSVFGFLLGALGSVISLSLGLRVAFQIAAALFMFATAMNLLNVHPFFRFVAFQPPKFLARLVRNSSSGHTLFAPALLGVLTVFIPCGVTQAMEVLAIASGNPMQGALIMFAFVLGTSPLFALIGVVTAKLSEALRGIFLKFAAAVLIFMFLVGVNGVLQVLDAPVSWQKFMFAVSVLSAKDPAGQDAVLVEDGVQYVTIAAMGNGYTPKYFQVKAGMPVALTVESNETYSCAVAFTFRQFQIDTFLEPTDSKTFHFTPTETGRFTFACSMGMYTGVMEVI